MKRHCLFTAAFLFVILCGSSALAERFAVSTSVAKIRSGPGKTFGFLWKAKKY